ncbi:MAG: hypothetical protein HON70_41335, partial [Lentisphaerae bacterium]|nr:hypothetical protein [Lentisphaerota bacterium]
TEHDSAWWIHNCLAVAGEPNTICLPSERGVQTFAWQPKAKQFDTWVYNVSRGWMGILGESGVGAIIDMDFETLNCLYACFMPDSCTMEWRLNKISMAPGDSVSTSARVLFVEGLDAVAGAGGGFVGAIGASRGVQPGKPVSIKAKLFSDRKRTVVAAASVQRVSGGELLLLGREEMAFEAGQTRAFTWTRTLEPGTYRLLLDAEGGGTSVACEEQLVVGKADVVYRQRPEGKRVGVPGPPGKRAGTLRRHDLSFEIETSHEKWAKPLPGGPIRAFCLVDVQEQRELVELAQRLDIEIDTAKIRTQLVGADYKYRGDRSISSLADAQERLLDLLMTNTYDVFVIAAMDWTKHFTPMMRGKIVEQVSAGAGLVWIGPNADLVKDAEGQALLPVGAYHGRHWASLSHPGKDTLNAVAARDSLARLIPIKLQRNLLVHSHEEYAGTTHLTSRALTPERGLRVPLLVSGSYAKARTVAILWDNWYNSGRKNTPSRLLPVFPAHKSLRPEMPTFRYWEDLYALLARTIVWAARRESPVRLLAAEAVETEPAQLRAISSAAAVGGELHVSWQDEMGVEAATSVVEATVPEEKGGGLKWAIPVPETVPAGPAYAHLILRDADGNALDWGIVPFVRRGGVRLVAVEQPRRVIRHGETADAVAILDLDAPVPGLRVDALISDGYGRELARQSIAVPTADDLVRIPFRFGSEPALGGQLRIDLSVCTDSRVFARRTVTFGLTRPQSPRGPRLVCWGMTLGSKQPYINTLEARRATDVGMQAVLDGYHYVDNAPYQTIVEGGVAYHPLNCLSIRAGGYHEQKSAFAKDGSKEHLVRRPCLHDETDRAKMLERFREHCAAQVANGGALDYCLGDEMSLSHYADYADYCFHTSTLTAFRGWLQEQYGTLAVLNAERGTRHSEWGQAMPMTYDEAKKGGNPAPWGDFRTFMEKGTADFLALVQATAEQLDPGSRISLSGTQSPVAGNGMDWWRMSRAVPLFHSYNTSNMCQARRSFSPWQCDEPWFAGYWQEDPKQEWNMWWCLFHNSSGVSAWYTPILFFPDFTYTTSGRQIRDHWGELTSGIWQQVRALNIEQPRVAVHYSQASIHATFLRGTPTLVHDAWDGWLRALEDVAVPYDFVSYEQVEKGTLLESGYRVLILPASIALSDAEIAAITAFVEAGNHVIADIYPGVTNDHCRVLERPAIEGLFGVKRTGDAENGALGLRVAGERELPTLSPADRLVLAGGAAGGAAGDDGIPILVRQSRGKGTATLLNVRASFYSAARRQGRAPEGVWRRVLGRLLLEAGVAPSVDLTCEEQKLPHVEIVRYMDDTGKPVLYGLLNSLIPGATEQHVTVGFDGHESGVVYDLRQGRLVSRTPQVSIVLRPGEPKLYAVLNEPLDLDPLPANLRALVGKEVVIPISLTRSAFQQTVRYEVTDSTGRLRREYCGVLSGQGGKAAIHLPLAVSDPVGTWEVEVRHVLTGARAAGKLTLSQ